MSMQGGASDGKLWGSVNAGAWAPFLFFAPTLGAVDTKTSSSPLSSAVEGKLRWEGKSSCWGSMAALTTKRREGEVEKSATTFIIRVLEHWMRAVRQWGGWWHPTRGDAASRKCGDIRWKSRKQNRTWQRLKLDSSFQCSYSQRPFSAGLKTHYKVKGISVDWGQESLTKETVL